MKKLKKCLLISSISAFVILDCFGKLPYDRRDVCANANKVKWFIQVAIKGDYNGGK